MKGDGLGDFIKNAYNKAKSVNNYLKSSKIISRSTDFVLNNPVTRVGLNLLPKTATDILEKTN
jgi:hypothetical protein